MLLTDVIRTDAAVTVGRDVRQRGGRDVVDPPVLEPQLAKESPVGLASIKSREAAHDVEVWVGGAPCAQTLPGASGRLRVLCRELRI